jgi:hypothetical protein
VYFTLDRTILLTWDGGTITEDCSHHPRALSALGQTNTNRLVSKLVQITSPFFLVQGLAHHNPTLPLDEQSLLILQT